MTSSKSSFYLPTNPSSLTWVGSSWLLINPHTKASVTIHRLSRFLLASSSFMKPFIVTISSRRKLYCDLQMVLACHHRSRLLFDFQTQPHIRNNFSFGPSTAPLRAIIKDGMPIKWKYYDKFLLLCCYRGEERAGRFLFFALDVIVIKHRTSETRRETKQIRSVQWWKGPRRCDITINW